MKSVNDDGALDDEIQKLEAALSRTKAGIDLEGVIQKMAADEERLRRWAWSLEGSRFQKRFEAKELLGEWKKDSEDDLETAWYGLIRSQVGQDAIRSLSGNTRLSSRLLNELKTYLHKELKLAVMRELFRPAGRTPTARKLGLIEIAWPTLAVPINAFSSLGIPVELHQECFERGCGLLLDQRCIHLPKTFTGKEEDWGNGYLNRKATRQATSQDDAFSFDTSREKSRRFTAFLTALAERIGKSKDEFWIREAYDTYWDVLRAHATPDGWLFHFQEGSGFDYVQLDAEKLNLRSCKRIFFCQRCGAANVWGSLGKCTEPKFRSRGGDSASQACGGDLVEADPRGEFALSARAYPHARKILLGSAIPGGLNAFEHTAQRSGDDVRRDELLFRRGSMNVLCSSTTLEMGIDLPDLDSVVLMGVPPAAANHTQRVGRAGRQRKRSCLALTLAGDDSFERWAHRDLEAFLRRPGIPPRVDLKREEKLRQHFFAWRLGLLIRTTDILVAGTGTSFLNKLSSFAGISENGLRSDILRRWQERYPEVPWTLENDLPGWGDEAVLAWESVDQDDLEKAALIFNQDAATLKVWLSKGKEKLKDCLSGIRERKNDLQQKSSVAGGSKNRFFCYLIESLRNYECLNWLAEDNILPRYGFPVSTITLSKPRNGKQKDEGYSGWDDKKSMIDRDRRQAVMEWGPGSEVVVANQVWTIEGLDADKRRGNSETHHRFSSFANCLGCGHQFVCKAEGDNHCPVCGNIANLTPIAVPFGYVCKAKTRLAGTETDNAGASCSKILTLGGQSWGGGLVEFQTSVQVAFLNTGRNGNGFWLCNCGALRHGNEPWKPHCSQDVREKPGSSVFLGEVRKLDVLRFNPGVPVDYEGLRALAQALRLAAAFLLELDPRGLVLADIQNDGQNVFHLVDLTDGGSGLLARLQEPEKISEWLELARKILAHEHRRGDECVNACPDCILTHDNRNEHRSQPFRRKAGLAAIENILAVKG